MKTKNYLQLAFIGLGILFFSLPALAQAGNLTAYGKTAWAESVFPIRNGIPGKTPFWNGQAHQFIYAPAFDYKKIDGAIKYRFDILSLADSSVLHFENSVPYAPLSPVWASVPVGQFRLTVTGISADGKTLDTAGKGNYYRAAPFNGVYHSAVLPYDSSARLALDLLMHKDFVNYWLKNKAPDPTYINYRYPAKILSALVIGALTHARLKPHTTEAKRSIEIAKIVADYMLSIRFKPNTPWEYFVPTYYGPHVEKATKQHLKPINNFSIMGVDAGNAFLELYDLTKEARYFEAAKLIAKTYLKTQLNNGSWYQFVNHETGEPTAPNIVIPTAIINYFDKLSTNYKVKGLDKSKAKALQWIMNNPVKTFDWQGQFEDVYARPPYQNLGREQACDLALYLFRNKQDLKLAEELARFAEDQFVIWEQPLSIAYHGKALGGNSSNWITPSVQEQFVYWMPVGRTAGIMLETFYAAYKATHKDIYLAKAKSIANAFTVVQKENAGDYPTFFTKYPMSHWLNSTVYPARVMMNFYNNLKKENKL